MNSSALSMKEFCAIVDQVIRDLPEPFHPYLENVTIDVELRPSAATLRSVGLERDEADELMGLFQGREIPEQRFGERHPNRITLYKDSIQAACRSRDEVAYEVRRTVLHELAHHFGFSEEDLEAFESAPSPFDEEPRGDQG